jgi:class 3 adenylate cyclase
LLLNILPAEITEELKKTGKTQARNYDLATVLFADFINFTSITEEMPPEELVSSIDEYFKTIDDTVSRFSIEKIKTVGDAYICASGLPIEKSDNPVVMVQAALDIVSALHEVNKRRSAEGKTVFQMRIGIHSGPLVAGVVGVKKFAYDIWGDTVNTAARMQQNGEAGKINISGTTRELVKHRFNCTYRGRMDAKHKGLIDMYFVEGKK